MYISAMHIVIATIDDRNCSQSQSGTIMDVVPVCLENQRCLGNTSGNLQMIEVCIVSVISSGICENTLMGDF